MGGAVYIRSSKSSTKNENSRRCRKSVPPEGPLLKPTGEAQQANMPSTERKIISISFGCARTEKPFSPRVESRNIF